MKNVRSTFSVDDTTFGGGGFTISIDDTEFTSRSGDTEFNN